MRTALTIAGSDPTGGAGLQADLQTFDAHRVRGVSAVTAIAVQTLTALVRVEPLAADIVAAQIDAAVADRRADATKIGMLATRAIVEAVADAIERHHLTNVVIDPVMAATVGGALLDPAGVALLRDRLLALGTVVTPNVAEAEALTGITIRDTADLVAAARRLVDLGARAAIVKGGHLSGAPIDVLFDGRTITELTGIRVPDRRSHGTGCVFSAALAARLALGDDMLSAAHAAKAYVTQALQQATRVAGRDLLDHFQRQTP